MKHIDPYRNPETLKALVAKIRDISLPDHPVNLMEVCGTHTMNVHRHGIRDIFPSGVRLISGPGCPVCVTPRKGLDTAIAYARDPDVIVTTFGDMIRVPGSTSSLMDERVRGADIRIVYSALDSLDIARENPDKTLVFIGIGFETTLPGHAQTILHAKNAGIRNFGILSLGKIIPPAMELLASDTELNLHGFLAAAHVSTIIGMSPYEPIASKGFPVVVAGFEPTDILQGIIALLEQISKGEAKVENMYKRVARKEGNPHAVETINEVFRVVDSEWLGFGTIPMSGMAIRDEYSDFDAEKIHPVDVEETKIFTGCRCGEVLKGLIEPTECGLFGKECDPSHPQGACMVSSEGTCAAFYKYQRPVESNG